MDPQSIQRAIAYIEARIAIYGQGSIRRYDDAYGDAFYEAQLPGGYSTVRIHMNGPSVGKAYLFDRSGRVLGDNDLGVNPMAFAVFMHNIDSTIFENQKQTLPPEYLHVSDILLESGVTINRIILTDLKAREFLSANEPWHHSPDIDAVLLQAKDGVNLKLKAAVLKLEEGFDETLKWDDRASVVRWNARVDAWNSSYEPIESANGDWHQVRTLNGFAAASIQLGGSEKMLMKATVSPEADLYVLKATNMDTWLPSWHAVAAVIVRDGDIAQVIKHHDPDKRIGSINEDLTKLIDHLEAKNAPSFSM